MFIQCSRGNACSRAVKEWNIELRVAALTFEEFLDARTEWDFALQRSLDKNIFLTWEWLSSWWRHYGDKRRFILVAVSGNEKILAAAPLMSSKYKLYGLKLGKMEFSGTPAADYHTFLLTEKRTEHVKLIMEYANYVAADWDCIEFKEVPEDSETVKILRAFSKESFKFEERIINLCPYILLPGKFEDYFQGLGSNWRRNMRRWGKKLKKDYKVDFNIHNDLDTLDGAMKTFFNLHQKRWQSQKHSGAFADPKFRDFHHDVAKSFAEKGWLSLCFLTLNGEPVSAVYAFKYANKIFNYLTGFDPQYSEYRVGHLIFMYFIKHSIENGLREFDFMRGGESYKLQWKALTRRNLEVRAVRKRIVPMVYDWITKNDKLTPLVYKLGERLSLGKIS